MGVIDHKKVWASFFVSKSWVVFAAKMKWGVIIWSDILVLRVKKLTHLFKPKSCLGRFFRTHLNPKAVLGTLFHTFLNPKAVLGAFCVQFSSNLSLWRAIVVLFFFILVCYRYTYLPTVNSCRWPVLNPGPLVSEATTLPTVPQPICLQLFLYFNCKPRACLTVLLRNICEQNVKNDGRKVQFSKEEVGVSRNGMSQNKIDFVAT